MAEAKYVIDVKDEFGWVSYAFYNDEVEAKAEAIELNKSFTEVVLIDRENSLAIEF